MARISELAAENAPLRRLDLARVDADPSLGRLDARLCAVEVSAKRGELQQAAACYLWGAEAEAAMHGGRSMEDVCSGGLPGPAGL